MLSRSLLEIIVDNVVLGLPPWIIFHPSRDLRNVGIVVSLVARLHGPMGPSITAKSAWNTSAVKALVYPPRVEGVYDSAACACVRVHACV